MDRSNRSRHSLSKWVDSDAAASFWQGSGPFKNVFKYFDIIDEFVGVRRTDAGKFKEFLTHCGLNLAEEGCGKQAYKEAVIACCVSDWQRVLYDTTNPIDMEAKQELLYQICIEVNPRLEVHQFSYEVGEGVSSLQAPSGRSRVSTGKDWVVEALPELSKRVIGQAGPVRAVSAGLELWQHGYTKPGKPLSFLFLGPTGVGKTELASVLGQFAEAFVRVDCGEMSSKHEASRLKGAPPGYVGHGGITPFEVVGEKPYSVILFDEIEKAYHGLIQDFLALVGEGRLTLGDGGTIDCSNCLIIFTSNLGQAEVEKARTKQVGFSSSCPGASQIMDLQNDAIRDFFSPESRGRIYEVVHFDQLSLQSLRELAELEFMSLVANGKFPVRWTRSVRDWAALKGSLEAGGARALSTVISKEVFLPLLEFAKGRSSELSGDSYIRVSMRKGKPCYSIVQD